MSPFTSNDLEEWLSYLHFQQDARGILRCTDCSSSVPPSTRCQDCTGCDAACSLCTGLEASDILPCINKGCVGEGTTQERLRSVGESEDDDCISVAAHLFIASDGTKTGISDCIVCTAIDAPMLP